MKRVTFYELRLDLSLASARDLTDMPALLSSSKRLQ